jgi:type IV pilus assembly protein PilW
VRPLARSRGLTLVELLVAMSIGLVVVGAMAALYVRTAQSNRQLEALARLQESARYAFEVLGYDIRLAGYTGCYVPNQPTAANFVKNGANYWWSNINQPLYGQDEAADNNAAGDSGFPKVAPGAYGPKALRGDTLVVLRANMEDNLGTVGDYYLDTGTISFTDPNGTGFKKGSLLLLTDCRSQTVLFQKTGPADPAPTAPIEHAVGMGSPLSPGNCVTDLYVTSTCPVSSGPTLSGSTPTPPAPMNVNGARLAALSAHAYYLRASPYKYPNSSQSIPALYRQTLGTTSGQVSTTAEELVSGVTDLQIQYGLGSITDGKSEITSYSNASEVTDWSKVLAVRVTLTLESPDDSVRADSQSFRLGNGATLSDRRLRRSYTTTFGIRNRLTVPPPVQTPSSPPIYGS